MGDIAEGSKWWSAAHFLKIELARIYKQNNAFMQTWKQVSAEVRIHVTMRNGVPWAFIYVTGGVQVCWQYSNGSEFISKKGLRKKKPTYKSGVFNHTTFGYWTNSKMTDGMSYNAANIYYKGKAYSLPEVYTGSIMSAMLLGGALKIMYRLPAEGNIKIFKAEFIADTANITLGEEIADLGASDTVTYAAFAGDDLIWSIERTGNTSTTIKAYQVHQASCELLAETTLPSAITTLIDDDYVVVGERGPTTTYTTGGPEITQIPRPPIVITSPVGTTHEFAAGWDSPEGIITYGEVTQTRTVHTDTNIVNAIQDVFVNDSVLTLALKNSRYINTSSATETNVAQEIPLDITHFATNPDFSNLGWWTYNGWGWEIGLDNYQPGWPVMPVNVVYAAEEIMIFTYDVTHLKYDIDIKYENSGSLRADTFTLTGNPADGYYIETPLIPVFETVIDPETYTYVYPGEWKSGFGVRVRTQTQVAPLLGTPYNFTHSVLTDVTTPLEGAVQTTPPPVPAYQKTTKDFIYGDGINGVYATLTSVDACPAGSYTGTSVTTIGAETHTFFKDNPVVDSDWTISTRTKPFSYYNLGTGAPNNFTPTHTNVVNNSQQQNSVSSSQGDYGSFDKDVYLLGVQDFNSLVRPIPVHCYAFDFDAGFTQRIYETTPHVNITIGA